MTDRYIWALCTACIGLLMVLIYTFTTTYINAETRIDEKLVEFDLTTVRDFAVQCEVPSRVWSHFIQSCDGREGEVQINVFKKALVERLRATLVAEAGMDEADTSVFAMRFAFNNKPMLKLLSKRAEALGQAKFEKVQKLEVQMDKLKSEQFDDLRTPNTFYCTFDRVEACHQLL